MSPNAQRIAIAEACGWKQTIFGNWPTQMVRPGFEEGANGSVATCPSYLTDLNAMHEAEKVLTDEQFFDYGSLLYQRLGKITATDYAKSYGHISATATQRAEAFLRTLNLWDDAK